MLPRRCVIPGFVMDRGEVMVLCRLVMLLGGIHVVPAGLVLRE